MSCYRVVGLMSGSSLDGIDLVYATFNFENGAWRFSILQKECMDWNETLLEGLRTATILSGKELWRLHSTLGQYFGQCIQSFIQRNSLTGVVDFIASHGHTVFHFPKEGFSTQIGDGAQIAAVTGLPTIVDFRSKDVALSGNGAPIVPIGEKYLFAPRTLFLNLGGIANVSYHTTESVVGFDVCCANQLLNYLANQCGVAYDENGTIAASGTVHDALLTQMNAVSFFDLPFPKSLDNSFSVRTLIPILDSSSCAIADKLATCCEHIAIQVTKSLTFIPDKTEVIYATGGGALNQYLVHRIETLTQRKAIVPEVDIVNFKEALIIAFMGVLRWRNEYNVLHTVTGAKQDSVNGAIYY